MYYKKILKDVNQNPGEEIHRTSSVLFSSVAQWWLTLCNPMDCSMPGLPSPHQLPELIQTHVCDAIHPSISSSVIPFSSHLQSFPGSGSFQMSQFFTSVGQSIGVSASASVLPMNIQDWFPLGWTGLISLQSKRTSKSSPMPQFRRINSLALTFLYIPMLTSIHDYWKTIALTRQTFVDKVTSLLFNMLSRLVTTFLPRSKCLLISWLQSPSAMTLESPKINSVTVFTFSPSVCHELTNRWVQMPWS